MHLAPTPADEDARLEALYSLRLLDTPAEDRFDVITRLAASVFDVPIAFVALIDRERQWLKSRVGLTMCDSSREVSFCSHAILQERALIIPDTLLDERFADNPFVTQDPYLRFYAGQPLQGGGGHKVGTLCIADQQPRNFRAGQIEQLEQFAALIERELNLGELIEAQRRYLETQAALLKAQAHLDGELRAAAKYVESLLPSGIESPVSVDWRFLPCSQLGGDCLGFHMLDKSRLAVYLLDVCGHGLEAALLAVALLSVLRSQALPGANFLNPASVLTALNEEFPFRRHRRFFTIWFGVLDLQAGRIVYSTGGHPPAQVIGKGGKIVQLQTKGVPIGCLDQATYHNAHYATQPGDTLFVFSDGAFELREQGIESFSFPEFQKLLSAAARPGGSSLDYVIEQLKAAAGQPRFVDDVSLLEVRIP